MFDRPQRHHRLRHTDITWDEFLHGYALPFNSQRIDPLNQQRAIRWNIDDMPEYTKSDGMLPKMRSNSMELLCRYQQAPWWSLGIYTESILTTLIITRKFGRGYPIFDSSHQYGLTAWYRLLMYCIYNDSHWSLVTIFLGSGSWIVLRVDPSSPELDKDTRTILEHLKWTQTKGPNSREASRGQEDILIDITVPAGRDTQTCGLRVLQYHAIIGNAFAARPEILR